MSDTELGLRNQTFIKLVRLLREFARWRESQISNKSLKIKNDLIEDLRQIIEKTRQSIATTINASLTILYWHVGNRIHKEILEEERAEYGKKLY